MLASAVPFDLPPVVFEGPFGPRRMIYADFTASGRSLPAVERAVEQVVLPYYGNTHSEASQTGKRSTNLREAARRVIREAVNADARYAVIFCGSGATTAINKLVAMLGLVLPTDASVAARVREIIPEDERPVVFVGPYEHHSNDLPWRESLATVVHLPLDVEGGPCLATLERLLSEYAQRERKFVTLSAASNVTGVITDLAAAARITHRHGAKLFADFAAAAPYLPINMTGTGNGDHLDAVFMSPHKFLGGPGASGVLVVDRALHASPVPTLPGGGTVQFVTASSHQYLADIVQIEEAGTPGILSDIRAGIALQLKADIGVEAIHRAEADAIAKANARWRPERGIELLGPAGARRLAIFSFNIRSGNRLLHHGLVVRLLNDLFGIQARGGCSCAGPYGHQLLGVDDALSSRFREQIAAGRELLKPGWVRLGLHYSMSDAAVQSIIDAVAYLARRGKDFLPLYAPDVATGHWSAVGEADDTDDWQKLRDAMAGKTPAASGEAPDFAGCISAADRLADEASQRSVDVLRLPSDADELRWFWLPGER